MRIESKDQFEALRGQALEIDANRKPVLMRGCRLSRFCYLYKCHRDCYLLLNTLIRLRCQR